MSLADLLNQATPGPWELLGAAGAVIDPREGVLVSGPPRLADARLIALAPDMARLLIDTYKWIQDEVFGGDYGPDRPEALLARFADLDAKAGGTE